MKALLLKDFRNALRSFTPAMLLGVPLLIIIQFTDLSFQVKWNSSFWLIFFISTTSLFYRSFGFEHRNRNFQIYTALGISRLKIFLSQTLVHMMTVTLVGLGYLILCWIFWSPTDLSWGCMILLIAFTGAALAPMGTLLGLMLQLEREFLFSILYLPLATPVLLSGYSLSQEWTSIWLFVLTCFFLGGGFLSALLFEFFFDELSETT